MFVMVDKVQVFAYKVIRALVAVEHCIAPSVMTFCMTVGGLPRLSEQYAEKRSEKGRTMTTRAVPPRLQCVLHAVTTGRIHAARVSVIMDAMWWAQHT